MSPFLKRALALGLSFSLLSITLDAWSQVSKEAQYSVREHYTKYEYQVPMRDGKRLFTVVYVPKDQSKTYPFLVMRTPYGVGVAAGDHSHYGEDFYPKMLGTSVEFDKSGYIFVKQDVRGRNMSEGTWIESTPHQVNKKSKDDVDESSDMYDTVEWLLKNIPGNNGKVGISGISYPGFYTSAGIIDSHPAIKAASPQAPVTDMYMGDDAYHGGAFMLAATFSFLNAFKKQDNPTSSGEWTPFNYQTPDGYEFFLKHLTLTNIGNTMKPENRIYWDPVIEHNTYDSFWQSRNISAHLKNIHAAVLTVGGWYDAEDVVGPFSTYHAIKRNGTGAYNGIVIGPWQHGGWARSDGMALGRVNFGTNTSDYYRKNIEFPFFEHFLKGVPDQDLAEARVFETGSNVWRRYASWPPQGVQNKALYLAPNGKLDWTASDSKESAYDEYVSDPKKPVPYVGYPTTGMSKEYMVSDQRFAATRPDVLVYRSEPLEEDVTLAGPIRPKLYVSTSGTDSDFIVKLIDVYPNDYPSEDAPESRVGDVPAPKVAMAGYQQLVRGEPIRGKYRHSFEKPEPFEPGKVELVSYTLPDVHHTFRRGHRIMVQIQSSWFPLIDLNPQTFVDIAKAKPEDFKAATERVYHAPGQQSLIEMPVLPRALVH